MRSHEIENKLRGITNWPTRVKDWKVVKGSDSTGMDAVWVWAILENAQVDRAIKARLREKVREKIATYENPDPYWVYVRFRDESELEAS